MSAPASPADTRAYILERLVGETGEPKHLIGAARSMATRALPGFARSLNEALASPVEIDLGAVELDRMTAARPGDGSFDAMTIVASTASADAMILTFEADALALVVGAAFGADAEMPVSPIQRELSPTEVQIAEMVFERLAQALNGSGERSLGLRFPLAGAITGIEAQRKVIRDGPSMRISFVLHSAGGTGKLFVTMPQRLLKKPRGEGGAADEGENQWGARFGEEVMRSAVRLEATIPMGRMTLGDLAALAVGQVIEMPKTAPGETKLSARDKTLFVCEFGKLGNQYTVRIRQPFDAGRDFIDGLVSA